MIEATSFWSDRVGDHTEVLTFDGECDRATARNTEDSIASALHDGVTDLIVDLRGVTSLGDPMLSVLFRGLIQVKGQNGRMVLVRPNSHVWSMFEDSGLCRGFSNFPDLKGALAKTP